MHKIQLIAMLLFAISTAQADLKNTEPKDPYNYQDWQQNRLKNLKKPHGWLSLVGLEWLKKGKNSIGSDQQNDIVLSHGAKHIGDLYLSADNKMQFIADKAAQVKVNDQLLSEKITAYADTDKQHQTTVFTVDSYQFYPIERGKMALRIKDSQAETLVNFKGIDYFPEDQTMRVEAKFIPYQPEKIIPMVNVLGISSQEPSPGRLEFTLKGKQYALDVLDGGDDYYLIFADKTNGRTTYGPGRFLYTDGKQNQTGTVIIDFNKAYNPPCAFTPYSTCSLPPRQNRLPIKIEAGEKKYSDHW